MSIDPDQNIADLGGSFEEAVQQPEQTLQGMLKALRALDTLTATEGQKYMGHAIANFLMHVEIARSMENPQVIRDSLDRYIGKITEGNYEIEPEYDPMPIFRALKASLEPMLQPAAENLDHPIP